MELIILILGYCIEEHTLLSAPMLAMKMGARWRRASRLLSEAPHSFWNKLQKKDTATAPLIKFQTIFHILNKKVNLDQRVNIRQRQVDFGDMCLVVTHNLSSFQSDWSIYQLWQKTSLHKNYKSFHHMLRIKLIFWPRATREVWSFVYLFFVIRHLIDVTLFLHFFNVINQASFVFPLQIKHSNIAVLCTFPMLLCK